MFHPAFYPSSRGSTTGSFTACDNKIPAFAGMTPQGLKDVPSTPEDHSDQHRP